MEIIFIGSGEAFDKKLHNISVLINSKTKLLLDCGYNVPQALWKYNSNPNFLDAVYVSHFHADHFFGVIPLLLRMEEDKRRKEFTIIGQKGVKNYILNTMKLAWKGWENLNRYPFKISFIEIGKTLNFNELEMFFALTKHTIPNYAIKVIVKNKSVCYSGDGVPSKETKQIYNDTSLLIHEAYTIDKAAQGHVAVKDLVKLVNELKIKNLAIVHIMRKFLTNEKAIFKYFKNLKVNVFIPKDLQKFNL